jgi:protein SCO1/2
VKRTLSTVLVIALGVVSMSFVVACGSDDAPAQLVGQTLDPPTQVGDLSLPDATTSAAFEFRAQAGGLLVVYFGYTACPDVCPTTLAALRAALRSLGDRADRINLAMATVDPRRDTASILPGYVHSFVPSAVALRTEDDGVLRAVADRFGVSYLVTGEGNETEVSHSGAMYVVDADGAVLDVLPFGLTKDDIANDLGILLDRQRA